jgi:hypothetical protein
MPNVRIPRPTLGGTLQAASAAYDVYSGTTERQAKGERLRTAVPKAAAEAGGGLAGSAAALRATAPFTARLGNPYAIGGANLVIGTLGYMGGREATSGVIKKLETPVGGTTDKEVERATQAYGIRKAREGMKKTNVYGATKGSAISGLGGNLTVDKKSSTVTTQGRTAKLGSTQLIRDPKTGKQVVGDLAYRGGKPVYIPRASTASRESNASPGAAWRNIQRSLNFGGQRERDAAAARQEYRTALRNTQAYTKGLGVSTQSATRQGLPGYGSKPAAKPAAKPTYKPAGGGMGGGRGSGARPSTKK